MRWLRQAMDGIVAWLRPLRPPAWFIRLWPGTSRRFGPPRRMRPARAVPGLVRDVDVDVRVTLAPVRCLNAVDPFWLQPPRPLAGVRPFVVSDIRARLLAPAQWVVAGRDTFLTDTSFWNHRSPGAARRALGLFPRKKPRPERTVAGRVLSLVSDFAPYAFGHWLSDSLPRWLIAERAGLRLAEFDSILLPGPDTPSVRRLVSSLGVPPSRIETRPISDDLVVDQLSATSFPGAAGAVCSLAREAAGRLVPPGVPRRRIYLTRDGAARNLRNHREVRAVLEDLGFETCTGSGDASVLDRCAEARIIIGVEGSQCLNALFAPPGGALVVIVPDGFYQCPYMASMAGAAGLSFFLLGARVDPGSGAFELDAGELRRSLQPVLEEFG